MTADAGGVLVDEGVGAPAGVRDPSPRGAVPFGFAVRCSPADSAALWHGLTDLGDGRFAVAVGRGSGPVAEIRAQVMAALGGGADPAPALAGVSADSAAAVAAVIDRAAATLACSAVGDVVVALAAPDQPRRVLDPSPGRTVTAQIPPGATVLLCTDAAAGIAAALSEPDCAAARPDAALDHLLAAIDPPATPGVAALLYRQPPDPLDVALPADPASLAALRARMRPWLALAGIDVEPSADILLAVGEAASNSTEHAVLGADRAVELTVRATLAGDRLRITVSDNGTWKPVTASPGHRGHGIKLITALVDTADLTTTENGTTVEMLKELRR